ncbi:MAG: phycobiliprotein lyase [Prochlorococcus sp. SP3034]|nr:phycobiliprotein lyase [Prochlorococcus sp. SP3034]
MKKTLETTKSFIDRSIGTWKSIRSSHSLAFQEFENTNSNIEISMINIANKEVIDILENFKSNARPDFAVRITWEAKSDWNEEQKVNIDQTTLVFLEQNPYSGTIYKNKGYAELIRSFSNYYIDKKGGLNITTEYNSTISFEKINFVSENVRFRYSIIKSKSNEAIIQTSHSSEIRNLSS